MLLHLAQLAEPKEIQDVLTLTLHGEFLKAREKLLDIILKQGLSGIDVIKQIQREVLTLEIPEERKARMIERCGEIEFRTVEGSDEFLQLEALLASFSLIR